MWYTTTALQPGVYWFRQGYVWYKLQSSGYVITKKKLTGKSKLANLFGGNQRVAFAA